MRTTTRIAGAVAGIALALGSLGAAPAFADKPAPCAQQQKHVDKAAGRPRQGHGRLRASAGEGEEGQARGEGRRHRQRARQRQAGPRPRQGTSATTRRRSRPPSSSGSPRPRLVSSACEADQPPAAA